MSTRTKQFIKAHLTMIDNEDWNTFFIRAQSNDKYNLDNDDVIAILNMLRVTGVDYSEEERQNVFVKDITKIIHTDFPVDYKIRIEDLYNYTVYTNHCHNWLGYDKYEFFDLLYHYQNKIGIEFTSDDIIKVK